MAELRLKYTEADASRRREIDRLKAQLHLLRDNTSPEESSPLLQYPAAGVFIIIIVLQKYSQTFLPRGLCCSAVVGCLGGCVSVTFVYCVDCHVRVLCRNGYIYGHSCYGTRSGNRTQAVDVSNSIIFNDLK